MQIVGQDIHHSVLAREKNETVRRINLRALSGEMVTVQILLRLNGHPSGPFNQDGIQLTLGPRTSDVFCCKK